MKKLFCFAALILLMVPLAFLCEYNIRDAGFVDLDPQPYWLYFYVDDDIQEESILYFQKVSQLSLQYSNIRAQIINITSQNDTRALDYFRFWKIESLPALILVSPDQRSLRLPLPDKARVNESIWLELDRTLTSPVREEILDNIVKAFAVILLIEGQNPAENRLALENVEQACRKISAMMSQLPKRIENPPHLIVLSSKIINEEKILLWSLDINEEDLLKPHIVVLFGMGRILYSPMIATDLTVPDLVDMLTLLGLSCDCGLDKRGLMGRRLPAKWDEKMQAEVVKHLGFDAENPMIMREIAGILSTNNFDEENMDSLNGSPREISLYRERAITFAQKFGSTRISPAKTWELNSQTPPSTDSGFQTSLALILGGFLILILLSGALYIRLRAKQMRK